MVRGNSTTAGFAAVLMAGCTFGGGVSGGGTGDPNGTTTDETGVGGSQGVLDGVGLPTGTGPSSPDDDDNDAADGSDGACPVAGEVGCPCGAAEACTEPAMCVQDACVLVSCGDGRMERGELCDDGNTVNDDGCDANCQPSSGVAQIVAGLEHTCIRTHRGGVKCWGSGAEGRTGAQTSSDTGITETPAQMDDIELGGPAFDLCAGTAFTCAAYDDADAGAVARCWGRWELGRLGFPATEDIGDSEAVTEAPPIELGGKVSSLACGDEHACAVLQPDGEVRCWGSAADGRLGAQVGDPIGDDEDPSLYPALEVGGQARQLVAGTKHTCVLLDSGLVRCWGDAGGGRLGNADPRNDIGDDEAPDIAGNIVALDPVTMLAAGNAHTCALLDSGAIKCWGENGQGQLGYGHKLKIGDDETLDEVDVVPLEGTAVSIAAGWNHTCAVLQTGAVRCWGEGKDDQLGQPAAQVLSAGEVTVDLGKRRGLDVAAGEKHTCVRVDGGDLFCFGRNEHGQLGYGSAVGQGSVGDDETPSSVGPVPL